MPREDKIVDVLGNDMSRALRLAASVQRALPCSDAGVMTMAAKVFGPYLWGVGEFRGSHCLGAKQLGSQRREAL